MKRLLCTKPVILAAYDGNSKHGEWHMQLCVYFRYTCIPIYYNNYNFENNILFFAEQKFNEEV